MWVEWIDEEDHDIYDLNLQIPTCDL
jgi:hypothetical protein